MQMSIGVRRACAALMLGVAAVGCGEAGSSARDGDGAAAAGKGEPVPATAVADAVAASPAPALLAEPTWFYRVELQRDVQGTPSLAAIRAVEASIRPMPGFGGEYWAVGYSGSEVATATPVLFPSELVDTLVDPDGADSGTTAALAGASTTVFVEAAGIDRITLVDVGGAEVLDIPQASLPPLAVARKRGRAEALGVEQQALGYDALHARYPHIEFLREADLERLPSEIAATAVITPTDAMYQVIGRALDKMTPALLASVETMAVAQWPPELSKTLYGRSVGATIALNQDDMLNTVGDDPSTPGSGMVRTIVHEAAHRFWSVVGKVAVNDDVAPWPVTVERDARELIEQYRLELGIEPVWNALQQTGIEQGVAHAYAGKSNKQLAPTEEIARSMGFATQTGAIDAVEDFAETVATAIVRPTLRGICHNFTGRARVTKDIAIPYAKVVLAASLGAVSQTDFSSCVGSTEFTTQRGIEMNGVVFDQDNHAQTIDLDGSAYFAIDGRGPNSYHLLIRLSLPSLKTSPLGLHRLDLLTLTQVAAAGRSEVLLGNDDERLNRGTAYGLVLVTEASQGASRGVILGLILHNGFGGYTDFVPFGTFNITD
jgi:hypothetical protein